MRILQNKSIKVHGMERVGDVDDEGKEENRSKNIYLSTSSRASSILVLLLLITSRETLRSYGICEIHHLLT